MMTRDELAALVRQYCYCGHKRSAPVYEDPATGRLVRPQCMECRRADLDRYNRARRGRRRTAPAR